MATPPIIAAYRICCDRDKDSTSGETEGDTETRPQGLTENGLRRRDTPDGGFGGASVMAGIAGWREAHRGVQSAAASNIVKRRVDRAAST